MSDSMFPLAAPTVQDGAITVDLMLKEPTRIEKYVSALLEKNLLATTIFGTARTESGAVIFDQVTENRAFADQPTGVVTPGAEFPVMTTSEGEPKVLRVQKTGGKVKITDEAVKTNDLRLMQRLLARVGNTMRRDLDIRGVDAMEAAFTEIPDMLTVESKGWAAAAAVTASAKTAATGASQVIADILAAQEKVEDTDLGYVLDTLVLNPKDATHFKLLFTGADGSAQYNNVLSENGLNLKVSKAVKAGEGFLLQAGGFGFMGVRDPISTETWREPKIQSSWTQTWVEAAFAVTDPYAMVKLTNLDA